MWQKKYCVTCHNLKQTLTIIMNNENQYFKKKINFMSKFFYNVMCQNLIDG